mmetsp:Transcript_22434/g.47190  ORF Transcript_22434/g.47190 Transcript_22434/m.47190 type:complete len:424 (-) Transcript_22434:617-1888(-)
MGVLVEADGPSDPVEGQADAEVICGAVSADVEVGLAEIRVVPGGGRRGVGQQGLHIVHVAVPRVVEVPALGHAVQVGHDTHPRGVVHKRGVGGERSVVEKVLRKTQVRVILGLLLAPNRLEALPRVGHGGVVGATRGPAHGKGAVQELSELEVLVLLCALVRLEEVAHVLRGGDGELRRGELLGEDPDVVGADEPVLPGVVERVGQVEKGHVREDDVEVAVCNLLEDLIHFLLGARVDAVGVDPDVVRPVAAGRDGVQGLNQLQDLLVPLVVNHGHVPLVPVVVVQKVHDGVAPQAFRVLWEHGDGGGGEAGLKVAELLRGAAPGDHGQAPQRRHLLEHLALVVDHIPRPQQQVHRVLLQVVLLDAVQHHRLGRVDAVDELVLRAEADVLLRPAGHVADDFAHGLARVHGHGSDGVGQKLAHV